MSNLAERMLWSEELVEHQFKHENGAPAGLETLDSMLEALKGETTVEQDSNVVWTLAELQQLREIERSRYPDPTEITRKDRAYRKRAEQRLTSVTVKAVMLSDALTVQFTLSKRLGLELRVIRGSADMNSWSISETKKYFAARNAMVKTAALRCGRALHNW